MTGTNETLRELLSRLERRLGLIDDSARSCCGVTLAQCHALIEIGRSRDLSITVLADFLGTHKSNVSKTVDALVERGLVLREKDPLRRSVLCLRLTGKGQTLFDSIEDNMNRFHARLEEAIPADRREQVLESLHLLNLAFVDVQLAEYETACNGGGEPE